MIIIRGRTFTPKDVDLIKALTKKHFKKGRTFISVKVCEALNWRQPNGWLKDRACRDVLRRLDAQDLLKLPPRKSTPTNRPVFRKDFLKSIEFPISNITNLEGPLVLELVTSGAGSMLWNHIINEFHYLGHKATVGRTLKFIIRMGTTPLGAASLTERSWALKVRDRTLEHLGIPVHAVANNNRFLILPNVRINNLASRALSLLAIRGPAEWQHCYGYKLECLETFVDTSRFRGTCYQAANWIEIGKTRGFRKSGAAHFSSQHPKSIFLYPLNKKSRSDLLTSTMQNNVRAACNG